VALLPLPDELAHLHQPALHVVHPHTVTLRAVTRKREVLPRAPVGIESGEPVRVPPRCAPLAVGGGSDPARNGCRRHRIVSPAGTHSWRP
jgi:hypothetical protein